MARLLVFLFVFAAAAICFAAAAGAPRGRGREGLESPIYTNVWAVQVTGGEEEAEALAAKYGFVNNGPVRSAVNYANTRRPPGAKQFYYLSHT